jgi:glycosyltransferase involved in cell wall biosynthesis
MIRGLIDRLRGRPARSGNGIRVHHGYRPEAGGPFVKLERMNRYFPDHPKNYNIIYGVSGTDFPVETLKKARRKSVPIVCHMNSCWHPAYAGDFQAKNERLQILHDEFADFVVYGSRRAMEGARRYFKGVQGNHEIIYNAVDIDHFRVAESPEEPHPPRILAAGLHQFRHRLEPLIRAMPVIRQSLPDAELWIAGKLVPGEGMWDCGEETIRGLISEVGSDGIRILPPYTQEEAPGLYNRADLLVHLKHMDWTPNVVAEAMACGLPIVHTGNGGVPEIVGDAGVSLDCPEDWDHIQAASPEAVAAGVFQAWEQRDALARLARQRAEEAFDLKDWIAKHRKIFSRLTGAGPSS